MGLFSNICSFLLFFLPCLHFWTITKPTLYHLLGLFYSTVPVSCESNCWFSISNRKIYGFCLLSLSCVLVLKERNRWCPFGFIPFKKNFALLDIFFDVAIHAYCCPWVEITSFFESLKHGFPVCKMGKDTKVQLSVISDYQLLSLACYKGFPNLIDIFVEGRLVLNVWFSARQSACFSVDIQRAVYASHWISVTRKRLDECFQQCLDIAVLY